MLGSSPKLRRGVREALRLPAPHLPDPNDFRSVGLRTEIAYQPAYGCVDSAAGAKNNALMRERLILGCLAACAACSPADRLEIRFLSASQRGASTEVRVFAFGGPDAANPGCALVDPRGLGPGDAPDRTGLTAAFSHTDRNPSAPAELSGLSKGTYTVVVEAWGPPCDEVRSSAAEAVCDRLSPSEPSVLRGYYCNELELGGGLDGAADLESFADLGSTITVPTAFPTRASRYDSQAPLLITDGLMGRGPLVVQLLSGSANERDGVKVRFSIESGAATLAQDAPVLTAPNPEVQDQGLAYNRLLANAGASTHDGGQIVVTAHAPGFEGSPIRFYAKALRNVDIDIERFVVPPSSVSMANADDNAVPVQLADLDGDGRLDLITVAGGNDHRLVVHYGGRAAVHVSAVQPYQARAFTVARLQPGLPSVVLSAAKRYSERQEMTPAGQTYIVEAPRLEIWSDLNQPATEVDLGGPTQVLTQLDGADLEKVAIAMNAADLDGDGIDEIAMSRCSYLWIDPGPNSRIGQSRFVRCFGRVIDRPDSEIALLATDGPTDFTVKAVLRAPNNKGGYREVAFADLDDDGSLDLVFASNAQVHGVCGRRYQGASDFGLTSSTRIDVTSVFGGSYAVAPGHFDDDPYEDLVVTGAVRASSTESGLKAVGGGSCEVFDESAESLITGSKTAAHLLSLRTADLNRDGRDDLLLLHRNTRILQVWLGGGNLDFAAGPVIDLPAGFAGELAVGLQGETVIAATVDPSDNALFRLRFAPR